MEQPKEVCKCPVCAKREEKEQENEEMTMAVLLALTPMIVMTLFGQIGFF